MKDNIAPEYLHISNYGKSLSRYKGMLKVDWVEDGEKMSVTFSLSNLKQVILSGNHTITTSAVDILFKNGTDLAFLDPYGGAVGYLLPATKGHILTVWEKQAGMDDELAKEIARHILMAASSNKVSILQDVERNRDVSLDRFVVKMQEITENIKAADDRNEMMGLEGAVSNEYFKALQSFIPEDFMFRGRFRRPASDVVNVMLNYGYGILYSLVRNAISRSSLNPYKGVLHASYKDQEALVYDLIEEFRQPVVDRVVITMLGRKQVSHTDYSSQDGACKIEEGFKKNFADEVLSKLDSYTVYDGRKERFGRIIQLQAQRLKDAIIEGTEYEPFVYKRR